MRIMRSQKNERRRGAALVEMAMVLPIFVTVTLGIVEFGRAMMVANVVTNAAREGARMGIMDGYSNSDIQSFIEDFLDGAIGVDAGNVIVSITVTPAPGNTDAGNEVSSAGPRDLITVRVEVPFDEVSYVTGDFLEDKNLIGQSVMRNE